MVVLIYATMLHAAVVYTALVYAAVMYGICCKCGAVFKVKGT